MIRAYTPLKKNNYLLKMSKWGTRAAFQVPAYGRKRKASYMAGSQAGRAGLVASRRQPPPLPLLPSVEFKSITAGLAAVAEGTVNLVNPAVMGTDLFNRVGRQFMMRSVECHGYMLVTCGAGSGSTVTRCLLVYDRQSNGVAPAIADVLDADNAYAMRNLNNRKRFKILMDRRIPLSFENAAVAASATVNVDFYRKLRHPVEFNAGNAGTVADITSGALFFILCTDTGAAATVNTFTGNVRTRFTDQ